MRRCGRRIGMALALLALSCVGGAAWGANISGDRTNVVNSDYPIPGGYTNGTAGQIAESGKLGANYIQNNTWYNYEVTASGGGTTTYGWVSYNITWAGGNTVILNSASSSGVVKTGTTTMTGSGNTVVVNAGGLLGQGATTFGMGTGGGSTLSINGGLVGDGTTTTVNMGGTGNTLTMNANLASTISAGSTVNVGHGTITLNGGTVAGDVTTNTNNSTWNINGSQVTGQLETTGAGDNFTISNGSAFGANSKISATTTGGNTFTIANTAGTNTFTTGGGIDATASGGGATNTFNLNGGNFVNNSSITTTASQNNIYLHGTGFASNSTAISSNGNTLFDMNTNTFNGTLTITGATSQVVNIYGSALVGNNAIDATITGDNNTLNVYGNARFQKDSTIAGDNNNLYVHGNSTFSGANTISGSNNVISIYDNANFSGSSTIGAGAFVNTNVLVDVSGTMTGFVDIANSGGTNNVYLNSGTMTNTGATTGSIHGSNVAGSLTNIYLNGTRTTQAYGGSADTNAYLNNLGTPIAVIKNLNMNAAGSAHNTIVPTTTENVFVSGIFRKDSNNTNMNTLVNAGVVNMAGGSYLEIGSLDLTNLGIGTETSQLTTNILNVANGSKFVIHEDILNNHATTPRTGAQANIINKLNINGVANINQTTVQGDGTNIAQITVNSGGMLHGFGELDAGNNPMRANLIGNLTVKGGGTLKPYDSDVYKIVNQQLKGVTFRVDGNGSTSGVTTFEQNSKLSTRLFAIPDSRNATLLSGAQRTSFSDSIKSVNFDFSSVYNGGVEVPQAAKVQYDPVFGFQYELVSKQQFDVYQGDGTNDATYYYHVAMSDTALAELASRPNANHLFNKDIIKSDMLGEWWFEKTADNKGVVLRFRLLAEHPSKGGIAKNAQTPNSRAATTLLDTWRYPFQTEYNKHLNLPKDPSDGNGYNMEGYTGDMDSWYAANPQYYTKYKSMYIKDFEKLLLNIQNRANCGIDTEKDYRQLHAEPYADLAGLNLDLMNSFRDTIERVGMSNLYQVESNVSAEGYDQAEASVQSDDAMASINNTEGCVEQFVCNPLRIWAGGFGTTGTQKMRQTEYGFDSDNWGGAIGAVKEFGDLYLGVSAGYARADTDWAELNATNKTDAYLAEVLVGIRRGMGFAEIYGDYAYNDQQMNRYISIANYTGSTTGKYHDNVYGGGARVGYQLLLNEQWLFVPTVGVRYMRSENSAFTELGNRDDLSVALGFKSGGIKRYNVTVPVMARLSRVFSLGCFALTPELRAGVTPVLGDKYGKATAEFVGMPIPDLTFDSIGVDQGRWQGQVGATIELSRRGRFYVAGNYDYLFRTKNHWHNYSLQTGLNF